MKKFVLMFILAIFTAGQCLAGGFSLYEFGGRASGMAGATVAQAYDISTIFYNPAGLSFIGGTHFYGGTSLIFPGTKFVGVQPIFDKTVHQAKSQMFYPLGIYFSHQFGERLSAGVGFTSPFGLGLKWKDDFPGRVISKNVDLKSFYISPVISFKISDNLSIGGGPDLVISKVLLQRNVLIFSSEGSPGYEVGEVKLKGTSDLALGFNFGLMYRTEKIGLGFLYRHSIENKFNDGKADFTIFNNLSVPNIAAVAASVLKDQGGKTQINYPNFFAVGLHYQLTSKLGAEFDYHWFNWSKYDQLALNFDNPDLNETIHEDYEDSYELRFGVHYQITEQLSLRAGYIYDKTPQPTKSVAPDLPDNNRNDFTFGLGYQFGNFSVDAGYMLVSSDERTTVVNGIGQNENGFDGTYSTIAHIAFVSFGVKIK